MSSESLTPEQALDDLAIAAGNGDNRWEWWVSPRLALIRGRIAELENRADPIWSRELATALADEIQKHKASLAKIADLEQENKNLDARYHGIHGECLRLTVDLDIAMQAFDAYKKDAERYSTTPPEQTLDIPGFLRNQANLKAERAAVEPVTTRDHETSDEVKNKSVSLREWPTNPKLAVKW